ncbi:MAG: acylphosphatase [Patescibacteria group bacterium]
MKPMKPQGRIMIKITGRVQGVSFRFYTKQKADELHLVGFVKNNPDDSVDIIAEGDRAALEKLAVWVARGPEFSTVDQCETAWGEYSGEYSSFEIR